MLKSKVNYITVTINQLDLVKIVKTCYYHENMEYCPIIV